MTVEVSRLGIEVQSSGIKEATNDLTKLAQASEKAESAASTLSSASKSLSDTQKSTASAVDKLLQKFQQTVDLLGANTEKTFSYKAAAKGLSDQQVQVAAGLGAQVDAYKAMVAQQREAETALRASAKAQADYAKAQGQAIEMNKRIDAATQAQQKREEAAALREVEKQLRAVQAAEEELNRAHGQALEMDKRRDLRLQAQQWRELAKVQADANRMNKEYDAALARTASTASRVEAQQRSFIATLKDQAETAHMSASELMSFRAAQLGVSDQAAPFIKKMKDLEDGVGKAGISAKQTAFAFRMLPAQFSDIAVQLAGGQNPFLILLQQGSQIKDSFGGIVPTFKALTGAISPVLISVGGLAIGLAALGYGAYKGSQEFESLNKALIMTGDYSGLNNERFAQMSVELGKIAGGRNNAAQALIAISDNGKIASEDVAMVGKAAVQMQEMTGQAVEKTVEQFVAIRKDPIKAVTELNDKYHFLTLEIYDQINALEDQGKTTEAATLAARAYADAIDERSPKIIDNLGYIEKAWRGIKDVAREAMSSLLDIGRTQTYTDQINTLKQRIEANNAMYANSPQTTRDKINQPLLDQIDVLQSDRRRVESEQQKQDAFVKTRDEAIKAAEAIDKQLDKIKGPDKLAKDIAKVRVEFDKLYKENPKNDRLKGVFGDDGSFLGGGQYKTIVDELKRKDIRKGPQNEFDIQQELQKYQNQYKLEEKAFKSYSDQMKLLKDAHTIDEITYLDNMEKAEQESLTKRIKILQEEKDVAARKKNKTAMERIVGEIDQLEQQYTENTTKYEFARSKVREKERADVEAYTASLENSLKTRERAIQDMLIGSTLGDVAKGEMQRALQARREFDEKFTELTNKKEKGTISLEVYNQELAALQSVYDRRLALEQQYNKDSAALRSDWSNGAILALNQYKENVDNVAGQTAAIFTSAFSGMNDALTNFVMTGKASFGDFAKSIIAQIVKMQIAAASSSLFSSIVGGAMSYFGGGTPVADSSNLASEISQAGSGFAKGGAFDNGVQKFADGGAFTNGVVSTPTNFNMGQMGEAGPEAIMPLTRTSDGSLGVTMKGGSTSGPIAVHNEITINSDGSASVSTTTQGDQQEQAKQFAQTMENVSKQAIYKEMQQGGSIWKMMNGKR